MATTETEARAHNGMSNQICPSCSSKMADLGDRWECPDCMRTLMKDYSSF